MKVKLKTALMMLFFASPCFSEPFTTTIEADNLPVGTDVRNMFDGVILQSSYSFSGQSGLPIKAEVSTNISQRLGAYTLGYSQCIEFLDFIFYKKAKRISLQATAWTNYGGGGGTLRVYDSNGTLIGGQNLGISSLSVATFNVVRPNYYIASARLELFYPSVIDHIVIEMSDLLDPVCISKPTMDFNDDCKVDFKDFAIFAADWLECNLEPAEACLL